MQEYAGNTALQDELIGITAICIEQAVAAPYCGMLLADAGARVIKVERPEGDFARGYDKGAAGQSTIFMWLNRGKESICLDLKNAEDMALLTQMLSTADIFVSNLAPGAVERLGLAGERLRQHNPKLITCQINGYGNEGTAAQKKAYDFLVQGESGVVAVTGTDEQPARVGVSLTDLSTGLTAFSAILRALHMRYRTQKGIDLEISMFDVMADWMNMALCGFRYFGGAPKRTGLTHSFVAPYGGYVCGDGRQILLSIQNDREWVDFCSEILEQPALGTDPRFIHNTDRYAHREELADIINQCFSAYEAQQIIEKLDACRIACARLNEVSDLSVHPYLKERDVTMGEQMIAIADLPVRRRSGSVDIAPLADQHGNAIRAEFASHHSHNRKSLS